MLEKDPGERYQSFGDVRLELRRLSGELTTPGTLDTTRSLIEPLQSANRGSLVGRETERADLLRTIRPVATGRGGFVVLGGEAGVGKSRLAEEALAEARRLGCLTLVGRCYEQAGTPPLVPYIEAFEEAARLLPAPAFREAVGRTAPELAKILPEVHRLFPDLQPVAGAAAGIAAAIPVQQHSRVPVALQPDDAAGDFPRRPAMGGRIDAAAHAASGAASGQDGGDPDRRLPRRRAHAGAAARPDTTPSTIFFDESADGRARLRQGATRSPKRSKRLPDSVWCG